MRLIFGLLLLISPQFLSSPPQQPRLVVWNVGQGQWVSLITLTTCYHFDLGGEYLPRGFETYCQRKLNIALFSHWDWDHIRLARKALKRLPGLCIGLDPQGPTTAKKQAFLKALASCPPRPEELFSELDFSSPDLTSNAQSRVFQIARRILNPGDSGSKQESLWAQQLTEPRKIDLLIVGHHGSKTSTSEALLERLRGLRQAVISARYRRYKHPHWSVEAKLRAYGVSPLRTEDWGNLIFPLGLETGIKHKAYFGE